MNTWKLVFEEDFSTQTELNLNHWVIDTGDHGGGNGEAQYYTPGNHNLKFEDGALQFEGRKENYMNREYTSAKIWTKGKLAWQYGRFEIVAKLPRGKGTWPAIWTLGVQQGNEKWPAIGEIDIMEHIGKNQDHIHFSLHTQKYNHRINTQPTYHTDITKVSDEFKNYAIEWDEEKLAFFVDGTHYVTFLKADYADSWPFDKPHYLILNLALGGGWGGTIDDSCLPQRLSVKSVRIYQKG